MNRKAILVVMLVFLLCFPFAAFATGGDYHEGIWAPTPSNQLTAQRFHDVGTDWWDTVYNCYTKWNGISSNARIISLSTASNPFEDYDFYKNIRIHSESLPYNVYGETRFYKAYDSDLIVLIEASVDENTSVTEVMLQSNLNLFQAGYEINSPEKKQYVFCHELGHCFKLIDLKDELALIHGGLNSLMLSKWECADYTETTIANCEPTNSPHDMANIREKWGE